MIIRYAWVSKQLVGFFFVVFAFHSVFLTAETASDSAPEKKILRPKNSLRPTPSETNAPPRLQPKLTNRDDRPKTNRNPASVSYSGLSFLLQTPLGREDNFSSRFSTVGVSALTSFELTTFSAGAVPLHLELGLSGDWSRFELTQPAVNFSKVQLYLPVRFRLLLPLEPGLSLAAEFLVGARLRFGYYDSRPNADGGFHWLSELGSNIIPDAAIGILYRIGDTTRLRFNAGYLYFAGGAEFSI